MKIEVTGAQQVQDAINAVSDAMTDKPALHARIAKGAVPVVRNHLLDRDAKAKRKPGWPRSGYWGHASESVDGTGDADAATITVRKEGVGLHLRGGTVKSKRPGGKLAIPLRAEFAGVNPREAFPGREGAFVLSSGGRGPRGKAFLAVRDGKALRLCYLLLESVTLKPDPTVLPPEDRLAKAARAACASYVRAAAKKAAATTNH